MRPRTQHVVEATLGINEPSNTGHLSDSRPPFLGQNSGRTSQDMSVAVGPADGSSAVLADEIVRAEIARLEQVFSTRDATSMLNRWILDPSTNTTDEFDRLLAAALVWQRRSRGAYNVCIGRLRDLWDRAAAAGCQPSPGELHELVEEIAEPPYCFEGNALQQIRNCSGLDVAVIAPGFMIDAAVEMAMSTLQLGGLTISTPSRTVHRGATDIGTSVGAIAEGFGVSELLLRNAAVTIIADKRNPNEGPSDVLDPLTGSRVPNAISVAVVAPNAVTADAVAAAVRIMPTARGLDFVRGLNQPVRKTHPSEFLTELPSGPIRCWIVDTHHGIQDSDESRAPSPRSRPRQVRFAKAARPSKSARWWT